MKVAILAGGLGTRLSEETIVTPKPMVEIGDKPMLWHIMKIYASYGFNEFVIALGYKGNIIKDYFRNYHYQTHNITVKLSSGKVNVHNKINGDDWIVHLLDTGLHTQTGGRIKQIAQFVGDEPFMLTYGDGVSNVNIVELMKFHRRQGKLATLTAVRPHARFGQISFHGNNVIQFLEKPQTSEGWINGGFFVLEPGIEKFIDNDAIIWEKAPMEKLARDNQLVAYRHEGFWQCMDTLREARLLDELWQEGNAPWKVWA